MTSSMTRIRSAIVAAGMVLLAALTSIAAAETKPAADASRIISIGGDITEILYAIGAEPRIVAVDSTSQFPPEALQQKQNVGYMRALSTEGVLSIKASLIIASDRSGPPEVVKALRSSPIPYVEVAEDFTPEGIAGKTRRISKIVGLEAAGNELALRIERDFAMLAAQREHIKKPLRALFVLNIANGRATVGGRNTSADAILKLAGAVNAADTVNGFKPISDEAMVEIRPEAIIMMNRTNSGSHDGDRIATLKSAGTSPAVLSKRVFTMDGLYLIGFGPRAPAAALDLMRKLYPDLPSKRADLGK